MITINDKIPSIKYLDHNNNEGELTELINKKTILFFYPKDDSAGCTKEACSLNDNYDQFLELGYQVIGISPQDVKTKNKFINKYGFKMQFICDIDHQIAEAFGLWQEKKLYGRTYMGVVRTTYIINEDGIITDIIDKVKMPTHGADLLEIIKTKS